MVLFGTPRNPRGEPGVAVSPGRTNNRWSDVVALTTTKWEVSELTVMAEPVVVAAKICQPGAVSGEEVAARAGQRNPYASREPFVTGSLGGRKTPSHRHKANDGINEEDEFEDD